MLDSDDGHEPGHTAMSQQDLFERRLSKFFQKPPTIRAAGSVIVALTTITVIVSAVLMRFLDRKEFNSMGDALWWALQTVTTVGYGDVVPRNTIGRIVGAVVMLEGIAFITVVTAAVTSIFIERARRERLGSAMPMPDEVYAVIQSIDERLGKIEQRLEKP
jgi:voltage-gated potassium channel